MVNASAWNPPTGGRRLKKIKKAARPTTIAVSLAVDCCMTCIATTTNRKAKKSEWIEEVIRISDRVPSISRPTSGAKTQGTLRASSSLLTKITGNVERRTMIFPSSGEP